MLCSVHLPVVADPFRKFDEVDLTWVVSYYDREGDPHIRTFSRKRDADDFSASVHVDVGQGIHTAPSKSITVSEAGELWIATGKSEELERATLDTYRQHLNLHIVPFLGEMKLSELTVAIVRDFVDKLRDNGRSQVMVKRVLISLGSLLADAMERGKVNQNVVRSLRAKRRKKRSDHRQSGGRLRIGVDIPSPAELRAVVNHLHGRWRPLLLTAIFTGLRASELRGLQWEDVDLKRRELHVRQRADRYNTMGKPKSDAGERTIPLPPIIVNTLREWRLRCPKGPLGLVFPNGIGKIESHQNILNRGFFPAQVAAGVVSAPKTAKYSGLHSLRHFYASWCINRKADGGLELPLKLVSERLGHSSIVLTANRYGHLFPRTDDGSELADAEKVLLGA